MADKNVSVRFQVVGGDKVKADFVQVGRAGKKALDDIGAASTSSRFAMQNAAFQVQDFFVQVASGTSATRALSQQLPQLLGSFGLFGALAGTAVAALAPLIGSMFEGKEEARDLSEILEDMSRATEAAKASSIAAQVPLAELTKQYGELADEVERARDSKAKFEQDRAKTAVTSGAQGAAGIALGPDLSDIKGIVGVIGGDVDALIAKVEELRNAADATASKEVATEIERQIALTVEQIQLTRGVGREIENLSSSYGIARAEAERIVSAAAQLRDATGVQAQAEAADALAQELDKVFSSTSDIDAKMPGILDALAKIVAEAAGLSGAIGASADEAARLSANLFAARQMDLAARGKVYSGRGGDPRTANQQGYDEFKYDGPTLDKLNNPIVRGGAGRGGGGGGGAAQREQNELMREAERIFERTRTSAERYADEVANLDQLLKGGHISQDTYSRAVDQLKDKLDDAGRAARNLGDEAGDALKEIILQGGNAREVIAGLLADMAGSLFSSGWSALTGALFPSAKGNVFDGGSIVPFARGGIVDRPTLFPMRRGTGLMGEAGPEAIVPLRRGADGSLGIAANGMAGGGVTVQVNVDARGATEGTAAQVAAAVRQQIPGIVRQAVAGVADAKRRGRAV